MFTENAIFLRKNSRGSFLDSLEDILEEDSVKDKLPPREQDLEQLLDIVMKEKLSQRG